MVRNQRLPPVNIGQDPTIIAAIIIEAIHEASSVLPRVQQVLAPRHSTHVGAIIESRTQTTTQVFSIDPAIQACAEGLHPRVMAMKADVLRQKIPGGAIIARDTSDPNRIRVSVLTNSAVVPSTIPTTIVHSRAHLVIARIPTPRENSRVIMSDLATTTPTEKIMTPRSATAMTHLPTGDHIMTQHAPGYRVVRSRSAM
jgi:hypothetical protein